MVPSVNTVSAQGLPPPYCLVELFFVLVAYYGRVGGKAKHAQIFHYTIGFTVCQALASFMLVSVGRHCSRAILVWVRRNHCCSPCRFHTPRTYVGKLTACPTSVSIYKFFRAYKAYNIILRCAPHKIVPLYNFLSNCLHDYLHPSPDDGGEGQRKSRGYFHAAPSPHPYTRKSATNLPAQTSYSPVTELATGCDLLYVFMYSSLFLAPQSFSPLVSRQGSGIFTG